MLQEFFSSPQNTPFLVALAVLFALTLLVVAASLLGFIGDADLDVDIDSPVDTMLDFLGITATPSSILVVVTSASFFLGGFITQVTAKSLTGSFLSGWLAILPALALTLALANLTGRLFKKVKLKEHTTAVHSDSFIGKSASIVGGTATKDLPAQAKLTDEHGQVHYFLVQPARQEDSLPEGMEVVLLLRKGPKYFAVPAEGFDLNNIDFESLNQDVK
jgi:hypothetical protein